MFKYNRANISLPLVATFFVWIKTYIVYRTTFHFHLDNLLQQLILLINPIGFLLFVFGISLFLRKAIFRKWYVIGSSFLLSFILYANIVFYRFFNDFITIPILFQTSNFGELGDSVTSEIRWWDFTYFLDFFFLLFFARKPSKFADMEVNYTFRRLYFSAACAILIINLGISEIERPQLLTRTFDRKLLVKNLGAYNYHLYDAYLQSKSSAQKALADGTKLIDVQNYVRSHYTPPSDKYFGLAKGRNLIIISLESTQSFVIHSKVNGREITPFLNQFIDNSYYFNNFYHQTGQGKTSDAEFIVENSLYPLNRGAVFFTHGTNTYHSMAKRMNDNGYFTAGMHANNKSFWNRDIMYKALGYQQFFSSTAYQITAENSVGWGLKDIPFLEQSVDIMKKLPEPFYVKMITLTNHHPFSVNEEDKLIDEYFSDDQIVNRYFTTVRYEDEAIKIFIEKLKASGLYDQSIIVLYGDHHGISENHHEAMSQYMGKETITPIDTLELQRVPFIIHIPGITDHHRGKEISVAGGQMNIRPTILHLMGISTKNDIQFGKDMFSPNYQPYVLFRDGRFVRNQYIWIPNSCYLQKDKTKVAAKLCKPTIAKKTNEFNYSDKVIYGDLLRFYSQKK